MDPNASVRQETFPPPAPLICEFCHQPIMRTYFFCPNCGNRITNSPLSVTLAAQAWIYLQALVLPMFMFLFIMKWPAWRYYKSRDPKARAIGTYAFVILFLSTIFTVWFTYISVEAAIQSVDSSISSDLNM